MIKVSILLILLVFIHCQSFPSYSQYLESQAGKGKNYTQEEKKQRQIIYNQNIQEMSTITDFVPEVNQFTDMTQEQVSQYYKTLKEMDAVSAHQVINSQSVRTKVGAPLRLDWREKGKVTSVKNQGSCGSCWTFATAGYAESKLIIEGRQNINVDLSEQYLLSCTQSSSCDGGYLQYTFRTLADGGLPRQSDYPYDPYGSVSFFICWSFSKISVGSNPFVLYNATDAEIEEVLQKGPVAISISSGRWESYGSGIMRCRQSDNVDHAVLLVGYTPDYWIVKNQWGSHWGQNGYIRVSKSRIGNANCRIGRSVFFMAQMNLWVSLVMLGIWMIIY